MKEDWAIALVNYEREEIKIDDDKMMEGQGNLVQRFRIKLCYEEPVKIYFRLSAFGEMNKAYDDKEAFYDLTLDIRRK